MNSLNLFKWSASITFASGMLLHCLNAIFGMDYFLKHILNTTTDILLSIPMILAALFCWIVVFTQWRNFLMWKRIVLALIAVYTSISIPFHVKSWFSENTEQFKVFPQYYSLIIIPVLTALFLFTVTLRKHQGVGPAHR